MEDLVRLRWTRSYLVRETQVFEIDLPREQAQAMIDNPDGHADQYVTDNDDPVSEDTEHVEDRQLQFVGEIIGDVYDPQEQP